MWRDFALDSGSQRLVFSYPEPASPRWTQLWRNIVQRVAITPDNASKESLLDNFVDGRGVRTLGFVNAHAMNFCVADPKFAADLLDLDHIVRDGIGVHALYKLIGTHSGLNLNGTDLLPELIARYAGQRIALFGTRLDLVERVAERLRREVGCEVIVADGFQRDGYYLECAARERPALVVLGMGMPKQ
ncbi:MAG TPA: WecB/TagA/CpsF family glycosyltransferase, partial [Polymorphobacter sp.]|nr:WecB/TagA/CpsF family glycosyltransferase [Polymorphobacter sp.]